MYELIDFFEPKADGTWVCTRDFLEHVGFFEEGAVIFPSSRFMGVEMIPMLEQLAWERDR